MKTKLLLALALTLSSAEAYAISRYNSQNMSCNQAQAIVENEGAVILRYSSARNPGLPLYDRYVADGRFCSYGEYARIDWVPTRDTTSCPVFRCEQRTYEDRFFPRH